MYSQLKPLYHSKTIDALKDGRRTNPIHVQLILSDLCNQDCHFCAYRMSNGLSTELFGTAETHNPNRKIPTAKAIEIIEDCAEIGVKAIQSLDWIRVSVDAGHAMTYAKIRNVTEGHWYKMWDNVKALAKDYVGELGVGFVITAENFGEIQMCAEYCKNAGVSNMRVGAVFSDKGIHYYGELIEDIIIEIQKAKSWLDDDNFTIVDLFGRRLNDLEAKSPEEEFCGYQYFTMYIGADLNVYRCCNTAYTKRGTVGNLANKRLKNFIPDYDPFDARKCTFCQFLGQNKAINAMIEKPRHVNFT